MCNMKSHQENWQNPPIVGIGDYLHTLEWMNLNGINMKDSLLLKEKPIVFQDRMRHNQRIKKRPNLKYP